MGLCMILYKSKTQDADIDNLEEITCWTQANMIHNWFVNNVQNGVDDCNYYFVSQNQILDLIHKCEEVIELIPEIDAICIPHDDSRRTVIESAWEFKNKYLDNDIRVHVSDKTREKLDEILPTKEGFFFGSTEYNASYFYYVITCVEILEHVLRIMLEGNYIYYMASW